MNPAWRRSKSSESAAADSCSFAPYQAGASTLKICEFIFARTLRLKTFCSDIANDSVCYDPTAVDGAINHCIIFLQTGAL